MLDEDDARRQILDRISRGPTRRVPLIEARGLRSSRDILATISLPGFDVSQMDGYALRAADGSSGAKLRVVGEQPAGVRQELAFAEGEAIRIFTGAPIPAGADAVIMQEDVDREGEHITIREATAPGEFIRRRGSDLCAGQRIVHSGDQFDPATIGVLASQGVSEVEVPLLRCAIVTTGDELVQPGEDRRLEDGQIFNSNGAMMKTLAEQFGGSVTKCLHAPDEPEALRAILDDALTDTNFCFVMGGVSVGDHDHVKPVLADMGVETSFWKVRVKPGKPLMVGTRGDSMVFGLPGNPVSAWVTFLLFAVPAMEKWAGFLEKVEDTTLPLPRFDLTLAEPVKNRGNRPHYFRVQADLRNGTARLPGLQQSHALFGLSQANALLRVDAESEIAAGERCHGWLMQPRGGLL